MGSKKSISGISSDAMRLSVGYLSCDLGLTFETALETSLHHAVGPKEQWCSHSFNMG